MLLGNYYSDENMGKGNENSPGVEEWGRCMSVMSHEHKKKETKNVSVTVKALHSYPLSRRRKKKPMKYHQEI